MFLSRRLSTKAFVSYTCYRSELALSVTPVPPTFVGKQSGLVLSSPVPASTAPEGPRFLFTERVNLALKPAEISQFLSAPLEFTKETELAVASQSDEFVEHMKGVLKYEKHDTGSATLTIINGDKSYSVNMTSGERKVTESLLEDSLLHLQGWPTALDTTVMKAEATPKPKPVAELDEYW